MRITGNKFRAIWSRLARCMADLSSENGRLARSMAELVHKKGSFGPLFRTIVLKTKDDRRCVKWASSMRAILPRE